MKRVDIFPSFFSSFCKFYLYVVPVIFFFFFFDVMDIMIYFFWPNLLGPLKERQVSKMDIRSSGNNVVV